MSLKRLVLIIMVASLLTACGKSDNEAVSSDQSTTSANTESVPTDILVSLPPEPAPEVNNATLSGVDSDGDGVRDDVQRAIVLEFYKEPNKMNALLQQATGYQLEMSTMETDKNKGRLMQSTRIAGEGFMCSTNFYAKTSEGLDQAHNDHLKIEKLILNSERRIKATWEASVLLDGTFLTSPSTSLNVCNFQLR